MPKHTLKAAVIQAAPVLFDLEGTLEKTEHLVKEAAKSGTELVLLPEAFIPTYPRGLSFGTVVGSRSGSGREVWLRYWENSVEVPGPAVDELGRIARENGVFLTIGVTERDPIGGTLYCSLLYFDSNGQLIGKHRKLKPTAAERIIWGEGDGSTLDVYETKWGRVGGLICWENYMPLARMTLYQKGIDIYLAPTADQRDRWQASMIHIALEGRCFVLGCNQYVHKDMYPKDLPIAEDLATQPEIMSRGGSVIVSPMGKIIAGPLWNQEGILYADLDMQEIGRAKIDFDVVGHYARPDVLGLKYTFD